MDAWNLFLGGDPALHSTTPIRRDTRLSFAWGASSLPSPAGHTCRGSLSIPNQGAGGFHHHGGRDRAELHGPACRGHGVHPLAQSSSPTGETGAFSGSASTRCDESGKESALRGVLAVSMVAPDPVVAGWCGEAIETGVPGFVLRPPVLRRTTVPVVTDPGEATRRPELGVLSALAHGETERGATIAAALPRCRGAARNSGAR
jgi:hypothetical protein